MIDSKSPPLSNLNFYKTLFVINPLTPNDF